MKQSTVDQLKKVYADAEECDKKALSEIFGAKFFNGKIIDRINSFEDAAKELGLAPTLPFPNAGSARELATNAFYQLDVIAEALREGNELDWANSNQKKWFAWFNDYTPGSGFRFAIRIASGRIRVRMAGLAFVWIPRKKPTTSEQNSQRSGTNF